MADTDQELQSPKNPYEPPVAEATDAQLNPLSGVEFTLVMAQSLRQMLPWLRFLSVIGFVFIGLMGLGGLIGVVAAFVVGDGGAEAAGFVGVAGALYFVAAIIYLFPTLYLQRYAHSLGKALAGGRPQDLEHAFGQAKSLWKFMGIFVIVMLGLMVLAFFGAIVVGIVGAF